METVIRQCQIQRKPSHQLTVLKLNTLFKGNCNAKCLLISSSNRTIDNGKGLSELPQLLKLSVPLVAVYSLYMLHTVSSVQYDTVCCIVRSGGHRSISKPADTVGV